MEMVSWQWVIGAAATALGAVLLVANSPLTLMKRVPFTIGQLEKASLMYLDNSNRLISAKELWKDNGAVIMIVRRSG